MKKKNLLITLIVLLVGIVLSMFVLYTPVPNTRDNTQFNAKNALEYISVISQDRHSVYDPANHETVRLYLKSKLEEFLGAANVQEMNYPASATGDNIEYDIHNLLGVIPGQSDTAIMLVAHYDSRGHIGRDGELGLSYGAADDAYGLSVLLETARLFAGKNLTNSIYILMTDGEETGLYGAAMAAQETELMSHVGLVLNVEARGIQGPAVMFETSTKNNRVIDFYKAANMPVSYSLATAVYTVMPNLTDFTEFLEIDKQGMNFAVLDGLYYYHSPLDNYTNVNPSSLQHYGEQIIPLVQAFTSDAKYSDVDYFVGTKDMIFFNLFSNVFVTYTDTFAHVFHILLLVVFLAFGGFLISKKSLTVKQWLLSLAYVLGVLVVAVLLGLYISKFIAFAGGVRWDMTYIRMKNTGLPTLLVLIGITLGLGFLYKKTIKKTSAQYAIFLAGIFINLLLALVTGYVLSGSSFLFMIPAFSGLIVLAVAVFNKKNWVKQVVLSLLLVINILIVLPILHELFLALTVGGLLALCAILTFYLLVMVPSFFIQIEE